MLRRIHTLLVSCALVGGAVAASCARAEPQAETFVRECSRDGPAGRVQLSAVAGTRDSAALVARGGQIAARYPDPGGVDVVYFADSSLATCTFPMSDSTLAATVGGFTLNRRTGYEGFTYRTP